MNVTLLQQSVGRIGNWRQLPFFSNGQFSTVCARLAAESHPFLPATEKILLPFVLTQPRDVRVVIVGNDPYPNLQTATGLAFSVPNGFGMLPPTLRNIFGEIPSGRRPGEDLLYWTQNGILLLNTTLTIPQNLPVKQDNWHDCIGWSLLIKQVIDYLAHRMGVYFMFFGTRARDMCVIPPNLSPARMIRTGHPSFPHVKPKDPLVAFIGSDPFTKANKFFQSMSQSPIVW